MQIELSSEAIQAIGFVAFAFGAAGFYATKRKLSIILMTIGSLFWTTHFFLLGSVVTACMSATIGTRTLLSIRHETSRERHVLFYAFACMFVGLTAIAWQGSVSLLPMIAALNASFAFSYMNNIGIRWQLLFSSVFWIANSIAWGSIPQVLSEALVIFINIRGIIVLHRIGEKPGFADTRPSSP